MVSEFTGTKNYKTPDATGKDSAGDCAPYDFVVACPEKAQSVRRDHRGHFLRVQVKCTVYHRGNSYKCHLDHNGIPYTPAEIDFFAAYVIPANTFYILPLPQPTPNPTSS